MSRLAPWALVASLLACAANTPPAADGPIFWRGVSEEGTPRLVTLDPDGDSRVTKLWIVVVDGQGYIRTGDSRWFRNIQRDPRVRLWIGGVAYPLRAELVDDEDLKRRIHRAFREKYGFSDFLVHPFGAGDSNVMRLAPRG